MRPQSENLTGMETTVTTFQRQFKKARAEADRGLPVVIKGGRTGDYVFMRRYPDENPFEGLEHIFGKPKKLPADGRRAKKHHH
jgi:acetoacetate decarboxylase